MNVSHTVTQLIAELGETYKAIDIRAVGVCETDCWVNVMAVVRLTYEDVETAKQRLAKLAQRFPPVQTDSLRINMDARPFSEWSDFCTEVEKDGILKIGSDRFKLRQRPTLTGGGGYFQSGYTDIRSFDGRAWPALRITSDPGGMNPLVQGRFAGEAHLLGYSDAFEAVNALCEINVSPQNNGVDLSVSIPVFATISDIRIFTPENRIDVEIERHIGLSELKAVVCLRGQTTAVDQPFQRQQVIPGFKNERETLIASARASVHIEDLRTDGWLQVRLLHPQIGEIKRDENYLQAFLPAAERNIILEAVRLFCDDTEFDNLLIRPYDTKPPKLNVSANFELHVAWFLSLFGFSTVVLGHYEHIVAPQTKVRRATVDILAASQSERCLLAVACTLNAPKTEDFGTLRYARDILAREVFSQTGVRIIPVIFTSATGCPSYDMAEGSFDAVPIIDADQIQKTLALLRAGNGRALLDFLANPIFGTRT